MVQVNIQVFLGFYAFIMFFAIILNPTHIRTIRPSQKLAHCYLGPFTIVRKVGWNAYRLHLPTSMSHLHPVFNVIKLLPTIQPNSGLEGKSATSARNSGWRRALCSGTDPSQLIHERLPSVPCEMGRIQIWGKFMGIKARCCGPGQTPQVLSDIPWCSASDLFNGLPIPHVPCFEDTAC